MKLRKILSEKERLENEKKKSRLMTIVIVVVLMGSTAAFALTSSNNSGEKIKYNEFTFIKTDNGWQLKNTNLLTMYLPGEVANLTSPNINPNDFKNNIYFLAMSNSEQNVANELNKAFSSVIKKAQLACQEKYENESFCSELPIKNCETETSGLIVEIEETENQSISYEGNCLKINGNEQDLMKSADRIIYSAYSIIK